MFHGGVGAAVGKGLVLIVLVSILSGIAVRLLTVGEIRAWSQTIRGVVSQAGAETGSGGGGSGANPSTGGGR